jgi:hypothetical protein
MGGMQVPVSMITDTQSSAPTNNRHLATPNLSKERASKCFCSNVHEIDLGNRRLTVFGISGCPKSAIAAR